MAKPKMNWRMPEELVVELQKKDNQTEFVEAAIREKLSKEKQEELVRQNKKPELIRIG